MTASIDVRPMEPTSVRGPAATDRPGAALIGEAQRAAFPFRDIVVARTYEPLADAGATLVARALSEHLNDVPVIRAEAAALDRHARHAALVVVGTPLRRRPAGMAGGDASLLAKRLRVPVVVVPGAGVDVDLSGVRAVVCGVRDRSDAMSVVAAGALADALDLQLVLVHVSELPQVGAVATPLAPLAASADATPQLRAAGRELLGDVARLAGRTAPGAACVRFIEGPPAESLCNAGRDHRAALVAVTVSRRGPFVSAVLDGTARRVVRRADRPVLVCPRTLDPALRLVSGDTGGP